MCVFAAVLWGGTNGLRAFTSETALRIDVAEHPRALPVVQLQDQDGRIFRLSDYLGTPVLVNFMYTRCLTVCSLLGARFERVFRENDPRHHQFRLLSISFDPKHDRPTALREYARRFSADGRVWRIARVIDEKKLPSLLRSFGVVVIPDRSGDFQHNAAINVIDRSRRLTRVLDDDASWSTIAAALAAP